MTLRRCVACGEKYEPVGLRGCPNCGDRRYEPAVPSDYSTPEPPKHIPGSTADYRGETHE